MLFFSKVYNFIFTIIFFLIFLFIMIPVGFFLKYILRIELYKTKFSKNASYKESINDNKKIN